MPRPKHPSSSATEELPLLFSPGEPVPPPDLAPSAPPGPSTTARVPKVFTYPGVFTPKPQPLTEPIVKKVGETTFYLGCDKTLGLKADKTLGYGHIRMALACCYLFENQGETRRNYGDSDFSLCTRTTWREFARLFLYESAPGRDSINKFHNWLLDLRAFPIIIEHSGGSRIQTHFLEDVKVVTANKKSPEDGCVYLQITKEFHHFLLGVTLSHVISVGEFFAIKGEIAPLLYLWLPALTQKSAAMGKVFKMDALSLLERNGIRLPRNGSGRVYPSVIRQYYEQNGENSIIRQLQGRETRTGFWQRVWLSPADTTRGCGLNLCIEEVRTTPLIEPGHDPALPSSNSRGVIRSYFLSGNPALTDDDYLARRAELRTQVREQGGVEFSSYERDLLETLEITGKVFHKSRPCLLEIKACLRSSRFQELLADVAAQIREGRQATGSNIQWVIDTAKSYLDPKRHEQDHRSRHGQN